MKENIKINGIAYTSQDVLALCQEGCSFSDDLLLFLQEWFSDSPYISVQTSGSTGVPKVVQVEKVRMFQSAKATCDFLGLKKDDSALLCMNLKYIGAKMVVVRAIFSGLNLITTEPLGQPLAEVDPTDFAAMTPLQVFNCLQNPTQKEKLKQIRHLIIGGGAVEAELANELVDFPHAIWSTYGMTETLSHIALRRVNGENASDWYTPFVGVTISLSEKDTLIIDAPKISSCILVTNDIAEINERGQFRILGRLDNVINSGGVKIQIEEVEQYLRNSITTDFQITSAQDAKFGEVVILLVKQGSESIDLLNTICQQVLPNKYWLPKKIFFLTELPYTETNKPERNRAKQLANEFYSRVNH